MLRIQMLEEAVNEMTAPPFAIMTIIHFFLIFFLNFELHRLNLKMSHGCRAALSSFKGLKYFKVSILLGINVCIIVIYCMSDFTEVLPAFAVFY